MESNNINRAKVSDENTRYQIRQKVVINQLQFNVSVNQNGPCEQDIQQSQRLIQILQQKHNFSGSDQIQVRKQQIIKILQQIVRDWSISIAFEQGFDQRAAKECIARLLPYGSYLLGVSADEGDIDLVLVAPNFIDRDKHFKEQLRDALKKLPEVQNAHDVKTLKNPIIKLEYKGQDIDISLGILPSEKVPENIEQEIKDEILIQIIQDQSLDENKKQQSINSLNGRRNNQKIQQSVHNPNTFSNFLKVLKVWSKKKGLNNNKMGYLGGIVIAIMAAKVCQLFPNYSLCQLIQEFFDCYSRWDWERIPLKITDDKELCQLPQKLSWKLPNQKEYMKIYTPCFPYINTTNRVNEITFKIIQKALKETNDHIDKIIKEKLPWDNFFNEEDRFLDEYPQFIEIDVVGRDNIPEEDYLQFKDYIESQFIQLYNLIISTFQKAYNMMPYLEFNPNSTSFQLYNQEFTYCQAYLIGYQIDNKSNLDLNSNTIEMIQNSINLIPQVTSFCERIQRNTNLLDMKIFYIQRQELKEQIQFCNEYFQEQKQQNQQLLIEQTQNNENSTLNSQKGNGNGNYFNNNNTNSESIQQQNNQKQLNNNIKPDISNYESTNSKKIQSDQLPQPDEQVLIDIDEI